jgi:hypothetical protein
MVWLLVLAAFSLIVWGYKSLKIHFETIPPEVAQELLSPVVKAYSKPVDPCRDDRFQMNRYRDAAIEHKQARYLMMADLSLEIERAKKGLVPIERLAEILRKYDDTETKMYRKLYKDVR